MAEQKNKILFLGTGTSTGVPHIGCSCPVCKSTDLKDKRLRASLLVSVEGKKLLIDCGPDFRQQALLHEVNKIDAILLTHEHYDHVSGIDDLRPLLEADLYAEDRVIERLKYSLPYIFSAQPYPGAPDIRLHTLEQTNTSSVICEIEVMPIRMFHFELPVLGFRIGKMAYLTDFNEISDEECDKLKELDVLVVDALRQHPHHAHLMLTEAIDLVNKIQPKKAYFTHMSHDMGLHEQVQALLPANVFLAYDGLELYL
jgi:phosphoribosyl 1,2-cyclic phosphate phosphodiesterase